MSVNGRTPRQPSLCRGTLLRYAQAFYEDSMELVELVFGQVQLGQERRREACGIFRQQRSQKRAALDDGLVEEAFGGGHRHQRADLASASGLSENGDVAGVAAERYAGQLPAWRPVLSRRLAMDRLLTMDKQAYVSRMQVECRRIMEQVADAVNAAPTGNVISGSEMQVRDPMAELIHTPLFGV
jgi:hypothetical protein